MLYIRIIIYVSIFCVNDAIWMAVMFTYIFFSCIQDFVCQSLWKVDYSHNNNDNKIEWQHKLNGLTKPKQKRVRQIIGKWPENEFLLFCMCAYDIILYCFAFAWNNWAGRFLFLLTHLNDDSQTFMQVKSWLVTSKRYVSSRPFTGRVHIHRLNSTKDYISVILAVPYSILWNCHVPKFWSMCFMLILYIYKILINHDINSAKMVYQLT